MERQFLQTIVIANFGGKAETQVAIDLRQSRSLPRLNSAHHLVDEVRPSAHH